MVLPPNRLMGNSCFVEERTELRMQTIIVSLPKRAEGIFFTVTWQGALIRFARFRSGQREFVDQVKIPVRASRKPRTILDAALRAKHGRKCSTKDCAASYSVSLELSVTFVICFSISAYSASASRPLFVMLHTVMGYFPLNPFWIDRKSTRLNSSHDQISYAV